ncbi:hypothetical protein ACFULT_22770 [Rhodococcus sp. NPDC057297]|uniref:hypothetical protein n=1 Tax=Rhodococcus sp. NPDC057297 TaxID=3346090 RepID=UPI003629CE90
MLVREDNRRTEHERYRRTAAGWSAASAVLELMYLRPGITRASAARYLNLSTGAATDLVSSMRSAHLLDESPVAERRRGRPTTELTATAAEIGSVITAHRTGLSPLHTPRRPIGRPLPDIEQDRTVFAENAHASPELDSGYYRAGVDARRRAHTALADVPDMVDDVEDRIEALLRRTLDLLGDKATP